MPPEADGARALFVVRHLAEAVVDAHGERLEGALSELHQPLVGELEVAAIEHGRETLTHATRVAAEGADVVGGQLTHGRIPLGQARPLGVVPQSKCAVAVVLLDEAVRELVPAIVGRVQVELLGLGIHLAAGAERTQQQRLGAHQPAQCESLQIQCANSEEYMQ